MLNNMTKEIIGVYFDFYGTLIDSQLAVTSTWSRIAKRLGVEIEPDDPRIKLGIQDSYNEGEKLGKNYLDFSSEDWDFLNSFVLKAIGLKSKGTSEIIS